MLVLAKQLIFQEFMFLFGSNVFLLAGIVSTK